ncbi:uncharacterized protein LOC144883017 [Branchiostoma floridae x Branchiostoma japonicum]
MKPFTAFPRFGAIVGLGAWFILITMTTVEARDTVNIPCWEKQACSTCPGWQEAAMTEDFCCPCCLALCSKLVTEEFAICEVPTEMMNCTAEVTSSTQMETSSGLKTTVTMATKKTDSDVGSGGQTGAQRDKVVAVWAMVLLAMMASGGIL